MPRKSSDEAVDKLDQAVGKTSAHKSYLKLMGKIGAYPAYMSRAEFEKELVTYKKVAKEFLKKQKIA